MPHNRFESTIVALAPVSAAAVVLPPTPSPDTLAIYALGGSVAILLPGWHSMFRGFSRSLLVIVTGIMLSAIVGAFTAEQYGYPYRGLAAGALAALLGPAVITRPRETFDFMISAIQKIRGIQPSSKSKTGTDKSKEQ